MTQWLQAAAQDAQLMDDFQALCGFGGRLSGSGQDAAAMDWALRRMQATGGDVQKLDVPYDGWRCLHASLELQDSQGRVQALPCKPLLRSASTDADGLAAPVLDLGQGRADDFARAGEQVRGKVVLVRHEYPFTPHHVHRRRKYDMAVQAGAAGFLIANPWPGGGLLSGSSGRPRNGAGIPAAYIDEAGARLLAGTGAQVRLRISGEEVPDARAGVAVLDIPGGRAARIVISAHLDGHDLGCSALDNATGVAVALAAARALAPQVSAQTPGLRVCLFCAEEWALAGSARYLADLPDTERARLKLNINLDTVAGDDTLAALISDFPALAGYVAKAAQAAGVPVASWLPLMPNSDHANFARHGIPALRLVAGFDRPDSRVNRILTAEDTPDIIREPELRRALAVTCAMGSVALGLDDAQLDALAARD
ncbi:M28 family peptidase [Bordetella sp. BOR01]|uniref:M28 family peptidase n=1 Tax=Bordetella sp. BOR01 TaxID=2854779 RepID=UPI001C470002|nr:M28 family peptidase [Bordetella sp. BOR01]MBV7486691.1 M28 family peptidase [Bordetella sp. BOR01]